MAPCIAFCKVCKKFHKYQDETAHDEEYLGTDAVVIGAEIWEPLLYPIETPSEVFDDDPRYFDYTVARLNKILEEATDEAVCTIHGKEEKEETPFEKAVTLDNLRQMTIGKLYDQSYDSGDGQVISMDTAIDQLNDFVRMLKLYNKGAVNL